MKKQTQTPGYTIPPEFQSRLTFRVEEIEGLTGIPAETLRGWIFRRRLPCTRAGRVVLIARETLERILAGEIK